uniref:RNA 2',3'-cyclic phosphodiesterase n=1 Tax=uncultured bacterium contig00027 TaxID=1181516 RepID=A0A806KK60_9BACT|nr:RNA ligase [uncultured bacterium contig00027]
MPRLFIAVNCNEETKNRLVSIRDLIKSQSVKGNFSRPENLHLTLAFLGETPDEQIPAICRIIKEAAYPAGSVQEPAQTAAFTLNFTRTGCFRHSNKELWWIGADDNDPCLAALMNIRRRLAEGLALSGISFDSRAFHPHITLGREIKYNAHPAGAAPIQIPQVKISFAVNRISLMKSQHIDKILVYTEIFAVDLIDKKQLSV